MKLLFIYFCVLPFFVYYACSSGQASSVQSSQKEQPATADTIQFATQVQPILQRKCSPCHFPGGKMYERMPFDKDSTIISHQAGILKRIKEGEDNLIIKTFILQNKTRK